MALVLKDRVRETSTTTGTGTFTLAGAVAGFQSFSAIGTGNSTYYTIVSTSDWEVGIGTWTSPDQLSRDTVLASTNGGALVTFSSGTKDVFLTFPAEGFASPPSIGGTTPNTITGTTINTTVGQTFPAVVNIGNTTGYVQMVDYGDGNDYLNLWTHDGSTYLPVICPGGITTANMYVIGDGTNTGLFQLNSFDNTYHTLIRANSSLATNYTLTLPTTAGSNNQVLKTDGSGNLSWATVDPLTLTGISDPTAPSNTNTTIYSKSFGGYATLAGRNALNTSFGLQSALWSKNIQLWTNSSGTVGNWIGAAGNGYGTFAAANPTAGGTLYQAMRRSTYANVVTTTNQVLGVENVYLCNFRGGTAGQGGFFFHARFGFDTWTNGGRLFVGMATGTGVITANPSALNNTVGFCVDAADNGAISFLTRGTAATKASTGLTITSNKGYDVYFYCASNSSQYTWQIIDINTGTTASGTATATLPTNTTMQAALCLASNAALTTASAIKLGVAKIYIESDY